MNVPGLCIHQYVVDGVWYCVKDSLPCTMRGCPNFKEGPDLRFIPAGKGPAKENVKKALMRQPLPKIHVNDGDLRDLYRLRCLVKIW